ncbi:hypothetical protein DL96DRAFT_1757706 [Flagelloscypha sp. PMI_526]|nr:hypothetical protein DL96DRAFT_1757706 [Flagelloscypha sp. PMI_526]
MATKEQHYIHQLAVAFTAGQWSSSSPIKAPNASPLSWDELFRKLRKHSPSNATRVATAEQIHALSLLLIHGSGSEKDRTGQYGLMQENKEGLYPLDIGREAILPPERISEAETGYKALMKLKASESTSSDILHYALAYHAYALGKPEETLKYLEQPPTLSLTRDVVGEVEVPLPEPKLSPSSASQKSSTSSFKAAADVQADYARDLKLWAITEVVRAICLKGLAHERVHPESPREAFKIYASAHPVLSHLNALLAPSAASAAQPRKTYYYGIRSEPATVYDQFASYEEAHRWSERLIWRWTVLASGLCDVHASPTIDDAPNLESLWTPLILESSLTNNCPPNFRSAHRVAKSAIQLRAWTLRHSNGSSNTSPSPSTLPQSLHPRNLLHTYRSLLTSATHFPRAGKRNWAVEDFVDLVASCQLLCPPSHAPSVTFVLELLWWATTVTFNSPLVYRHMSRLLYLNGDFKLARRTTAVYTQGVGKAWEARMAGGMNNEADEEALGSVDIDSHRADKNAPASEQHDANALDMLPVCSRTFFKSQSNALDLVEDEQLHAEVSLAEGIVESVLAIREWDPHTRSSRLRSAHSHLLSAVDTSPEPTASMWWHLATSWLRIHALSAQPSIDSPQNGMANGSAQLDESDPLEKALEAASSALSLGPTEVRNWHLLGLILGMMERWPDAKDILERGCELGEVDLEGGDTESVGTVKGGSSGDRDGMVIERPAPPPVVTIDGLPPTPVEEEEEEQDKSVLKMEEVRLLTLPEKEGELLQLPALPDLVFDLEKDYFPPGQMDKFAYALQVRLSLGAVVEQMDGAEGAVEYWVPVFAWVADRTLHTSKRASTTISHDNSQSLGRQTTKFSDVSGSVAPTASIADHTTEASQPSSAPTVLATPRIDVHSANAATPSFNIVPATPNDITPRQEHVVPPSLGLSLQGEAVGRTAREQLGSDREEGAENIEKSGASREIQDYHYFKEGGKWSYCWLRRSSFKSWCNPYHYKLQSIHSRRRRISRRIQREGRRSYWRMEPTMTTILTRYPTFHHHLQSTEPQIPEQDEHIDQARAAIQEAEVKDEDNPAVWVQVISDYTTTHMVDIHLLSIRSKKRCSFARMTLQRPYISADFGSPTPHIRTPSTPTSSASSSSSSLKTSSNENVDLAAGILEQLTRGPGWDVPEAWYFLAKAYAMQERKDKERECLGIAVKLSERRGARDVGIALGSCL